MAKTIKGASDIRINKTTKTKDVGLKMEELKNGLRELSTINLLRVLKEVGVGSEYFTCYMCGDVKKREDFYTSTDPLVKTGVTRICKSCCANLAMPIDQKTKLQAEPTQETLQQYLDYVDKPFLEDVYNASILECNNQSITNLKTNVFTAYAKNIAMRQYNLLRFKDSDMFNPNVNIEIKESFDAKDKEILEEYEKNRQDTIRLLGYDPFVNEQDIDKPFLYAQFIGYCDVGEDVSADMMRISSVIEIVKSFAHIEKMNDMIAALIKDVAHLEKNISTIKALEDTKSKITSSIQKLAMESCISLKNTKSVKRGDDTFTGRTRKLKEMNLREAEVNGFDIDTCKGMRQVADISNESILNKIKLDENDYNDMLAEQRILLQKSIERADKFEEQARILLRENVDLKDYLNSLGLLDQSMLSTSDVLTEDSVGDMDE